MPLRLISSTVPRTIHRIYSSKSVPLINVVDHKISQGTGSIRILSLSRPSARNAISRQLLSELRTQVEAVASEYNSSGEEVAIQKPEYATMTENSTVTRALILSSEVDSCFCAGADLKERSTFSPEETTVFLSSLRDTFKRLAALPIPTISAVSSLALGGGLELALCTHMRVMASTSLIGLPETRLGIIPGAGGTYRLPALIGSGKARDLILTGRRVTGAEAYSLGLADRLVKILPQSTENTAEQESNESLLKRANLQTLAEAIKLANEICDGGPIAIRAALQAVAHPQEETENRMYERVVATADRNEALAAFRDKRKPVFRGR